MFDFTPLIADSVPLIAATIVVVFAVGIVLESFRRTPLVRRDPRPPRLVPRPVRHVDEADEARAMEWLRSESGQCPPPLTPNSDSPA